MCFLLGDLPGSRISNRPKKECVSLGFYPVRSAPDEPSWFHNQLAHDCYHNPKLPMLSLCMFRNRLIALV